MIDELIKKIREDKENRDRFETIFIERQVAARTVLLNEGEIACYIHFIKNGCLRECFNKDGKDITFQFFFEGQPVASIDSVMNNTPSLFSIESIEPTTILSVKKQDFEMLLSTYPELKDKFQSFIFQRFSNYARLFLSRIKDTPQERYEDLVKNQPNIIKRIPQHYIASYLGITPVSLSRIRNRK
ncbi:Crp/Fnr family transcriptional regulator [uncultured Bacteroides sp.]|uniref:Crp/Fnr family transcriptional regulator n=1 Tax=uncultured Bacteroides sp. TaxID=162156 RepID=UPI002AAB5715|nr:Crp/Fnr family transcriptional regulator [uncultured Bacteroides sp.]